PYAGLALIVLPLLVRDRRLWFGAATLFLFFVPLLFLPGRLYAAYCYLPMAGFAVMLATVAGKPRLMPVIALLAAVWIPLNIAQLRKNRRQTLTIHAENRAYVSALADFAKKSSTTRVFVYDGQPSSLHTWGIDGALRYLYGHPNPELYSIEHKQAATALQRDDVALLRWSPNESKLDVISSKTEERYLAMNRRTPPWQLRAGWYS